MDFFTKVSKNLNEKRKKIIFIITKTIVLLHLSI